MKKNYITPKMNLSKTTIQDSICVASIKTGKDGVVVPDETDKDFEVGTKNRFYNDTDDSWE